MRIVKLTKETTKNILENMLKRSPSQYGEYESRVQAIIQNIKENGDEALFSYTKQFDKADIDASNVKVTEAEFEEAYKTVDPALLDVIRKALVNIESYHELQKQNSWFKSTPQGTMLGQKVTPLEKVGVYVPGGKAVYPSSVLMNIMPAKVAGVDKIIMTTPCNAEGKVNPAVLVAAKEAGADEVYKAGGAQAIAALAFGTESIPKVDKIVGPGNIYVALAKKSRIWSCKHRFHRGTERDPGTGRRDSQPALCGSRSVISGRTRRAGICDPDHDKRRLRKESQRRS